MLLTFLLICEFKMDGSSKERFELTICRMLLADALVLATVFFRYLIVRVVFEGPTPNLSVSSSFEGSKEVSEIWFLPFLFKTTFVGSATDGLLVCALLPNPNCKVVSALSLSTTNLLGTTMGFQYRDRIDAARIGFLFGILL
jgi:hypothetical protein